MLQLHTSVAELCEGLQKQAESPGLCLHCSVSAAAEERSTTTSSKGQRCLNDAVWKECVVTEWEPGKLLLLLSSRVHLPKVCVDLLE